MTHWGLYRLVLHVLPKTGKLNDSNFSETESKKIERILQAHRCVGAALCAFDETGVRNTLAFGVSHAPNTAVQQDTVFRAASVSKFVTALGAMKCAGSCMAISMINAWRCSRSSRVVSTSATAMR